MTNWLSPWLWAPLVMLLALEMYPVATIFVGGAYLLIPIAGYLAARHGTNGWAVVAVSGLVAFVPVEVPGAARPELGIYLAALLVGWGLRDEPLTAGTAPLLRLNLWVYLGIFLLPIQLGLGAWLSDIAEFNLLAPQYLLVFLLGVRRLPVRPIVLALIAAATFGILLEYLALPRHAAEWIGGRRAELPLLGMTSLRDWYVHYAFDSPAALLTALGFLYFGRFLGSPTDREVLELPPPMVRVGLLFVVVLLTFGSKINGVLAPDAGVALHWLGHAYAVVLLGMLAGFFFRFAGIITMLFVAIGFWWIDALLGTTPERTELRVFIDLGTLLYLYGFGLLGIGMRDALQGTISTLWSWLWLRYLTLYFLVLLAVINVDSGGALLLLAFTFVAGIALTMVVGHIRDRLRPQKVEVAGGWLSLLTVVMASYLVYTFSTGAWEGALEAVKGVSDLIGTLILSKAVLDEEDLMMIGIVAAVLLMTSSLIISTLRKLIESAGQLVNDLKALLDRLRTGEPVVITIGTPAPKVTHDVRPAEPASRLQNALTWTNRTVLAGAVVLPLALFGYNGWLEYQEELADDREFAEFDRRSEEREHDRQKRESARREREQIRIVFIEKLSHAAIEVLVKFPDVVATSRDFRGTVSTGWQVDAVDQDVRRRVSVSISITRSQRVDQTPPEESVPRSIRVQVDRQERGRFGLWVEPGYPDQSDPELAKSLEADMEARAIATLTGKQVGR